MQEVETKVKASWLKKYAPIDKQLFVENRQRFIQKMPPNSIAIFNANDEMPRSADGFHRFRQNSDLFYLSGIDQEKTVFILFPDCPKEEYREILFIKRTSEHIAIWEGEKYTKEQAREVSGIESVYWTEQFDALFPQLMQMAANVYLNLNEHSRMDTTVPDKDLRFARSLQHDFPLHNYHRSAPTMHQLRAIKSPIEVALIQQAVDITAKGFDRILRFVKPDVWEYEIEAEIFHEFLRNRATGTAYDSIVASGKNACVLHYINNNNQCKAGEVLLMDFGAEYANYAADLTRSIPVDGRFTQRQRAVYDAVLRIFKFAKSMLTPGTLMEEYHKEIGSFVEAELIDLGLLDAAEVKEQDPKKPLYKKYFMHGTSHFLGLDVHDVGNRYEPMKAGMVFTCEPGIYIRDEGLGIRLENDILLTETGNIDLMSKIPIEAEEIEEIMNAR